VPGPRKISKGGNIRSRKTSSPNKVKAGRGATASHAPSRVGGGGGGRRGGGGGGIRRGGRTPTGARHYGGSGSVTSTSGSRGVRKSGRRPTRIRKRFRSGYQRKVTNRAKTAYLDLQKASRLVKQGSRPGLKKLDYIDRQTVLQAKKYGLRPSHLAGQQEQESGRDPNVGHSSAGAFGLTQFIPSTAASYGVQEGSDKKSLKTQIAGQAKYMSDLGATKDPADFQKATGGYYGALDPAYYEPVMAQAQDYKHLDKVSTKPGPPPKQAKRQLQKAGGRLKRAVREADRIGIAPKKDVRPLLKQAAQAQRGKPVQGRPVGGAPAPGGNKRPFKHGQVKNPGKLINPKWDADDDGHTETVLAKGISKPVKKWAKKYDITVGAAYDPGGGHVSAGHNNEGTATDIYPRENTEEGWDRLEEGIAVLASQGFEVGYDASLVPGTQSWSNHGRNNHAHVEWVGQGSAPDALTKLAGVPRKKLAQIEKAGGSGDTVNGIPASTAAITGGGGGSAAASVTAGGAPGARGAAPLAGGRGAAPPPAARRGGGGTVSNAAQPSAPSPSVDLLGGGEFGDLSDEEVELLMEEDRKARVTRDVYNALTRTRTRKRR
jgi:hypothetical protein